ncbi:MAG: YbhB/YbcL family Raf kinase inhibitor-like protein [Candidatus Paceibacterota bacterium]
MKNGLKIIILLLVITAITTFTWILLQRSEQVSNKTGDMKITSPAFEPNQPIPDKYTCTGEDINPPLKFEEIPQKAESLVLIVDDPDAPSGTWLHWTVWNINPNVGEIKENTIPSSAVEGMTDFGEPGYGGPCPPSGEHRYRFKVFALSRKLNLKEGAEQEELERALEDYIIEKDQLVGVYSK